MWRGRTTACSRKTVPSPKADSASLAAVVSASGRSRGSWTKRSPRPPPPEAAFTNRGKPTSLARSTSSWGSAPAGRDADRSVGRPAAVAAASARTLLPARSKRFGRGTNENEIVLHTGRSEVGRLREEPIARIDGVSPGEVRHAHEFIDLQIRAHGRTALADLVALVGLLAVQRVAVLVGEDRHRGDARARWPRERRGSRSLRGWRRGALRITASILSWWGGERRAKIVMRLLSAQGVTLDGTLGVSDVGAQGSNERVRRLAVRSRGRSSPSRGS